MLPLKKSVALENFEKILTRFAQWIQWPSNIAICVMPIVICVDIVMRFFGKAMLGSIEVQNNLLVLNTFSTIALLQITHTHMGIELIYDNFSDFFKKVADCMVSTLSFSVLCLLAYQAFNTFVKKTGYLSDELFIPVQVYYIIPVIGLALACIMAGFNMIKDLWLNFINKRIVEIILGILLTCAIIYFPFWYKAADFDISYFALGGIIFLIMFFLLFCKMPIAWVMCTAGAIGLAIVSRSLIPAMSYIGSTPYAAVAQNAFVALPMFVLMGTLILYSGISQDLFECANKWIGHKPGGLGIATIAGCTGFAAVSGDSMATAVTMGSVALPEMEKLKYDNALSTGALAAGGTLGILIPPSSGFIIYGIVTETSIGRLFLAGVIPGLLLASMFMLYIYYVAKTSPEKAPAGQRYPYSERLRSLSGVLPMIALFVLVLGGIILGIFSPTEGGGVGAMGAFLFALAKGKASYANISTALKVAGSLSAKRMSIMIGVGILGYFFAATRLPFEIADWLTGFDLNRYIILAIIIFVFIILGCVMNVMPMLTLILPSLFPSIVALGFDPVWFGVVSVMVMEMGQITPPVGVVVFALAGVATKIPMVTIFRGIVPFLMLIILGVVIVTAFPGLATWLPNTVIGIEQL